MIGKSLTELVGEHGWFAAICTLLGVVVKVLVDWIFKLRVRELDEGTAIRNELRAEIKRLSEDYQKNHTLLSDENKATRADCAKETFLLEGKIEEWRAKFYGLWEQYTVLQVKYDVLNKDFKELQETVEAMQLREEEKRLSGR